MKTTQRKPLGWFVGTAALALALGASPAAAAGCSQGPAKDIVDTAASAGSFGTLVAAVKAAGLVEALKGDGPFTVFAPTDEAFAKLPAGTVDALLRPENKDKLAEVLTYHVVAGNISSADAKTGRVATLQGSKLSVSRSDDTLMIDQARVITADIVAANGVIHVIDEVILPPEMRASADTPAGDLIRLAIDRGVPLFNRGQAAACAAIYEVAAESLLNSTGSGLDDRDRDVLRSAMRSVRHTSDATEQAWIMRGALDRVLATIDHRADGLAMAMSR